ncbi:nucleotidyltransferase family protein [Rhodobacteraceae bacterium D3-12]|nr:nucleotidyltransferase family protein [Rhodobacteraceae bacterium D3-12]
MPPAERLDMARNVATDDIAILIPAAGASSRMGGRDKLLEQVDGTPLLARQVARALATGAEVLVTVSQDHPARKAALAPLASARLHLCEIDGREGMAVSLREGAAWAIERGLSALMVVLADMPELETEDFTALLDAATEAPGSVIRAASATGVAGHPVIIPQRLFEGLRSVTGDAGARGVLQGEQVRLTPRSGNRAVTDLDTPEDWARWRAARR